MFVSVSVSTHQQSVCVYWQLLNFTAMSVLCVGVYDLCVGVVLCAGDTLPNSVFRLQHNFLVGTIPDATLSLFNCSSSFDHNCLNSTCLVRIGCSSGDPEATPPANALSTSAAATALAIETIVIVSFIGSVALGVVGYVVRTKLCGVPAEGKGKKGGDVVVLPPPPPVVVVGDGAAVAAVPLSAAAPSAVGSSWERQGFGRRRSAGDRADGGRWS